MLYSERLVIVYINMMQLATLTALALPHLFLLFFVSRAIQPSISLTSACIHLSSFCPSDTIDWMGLEAFSAPFRTSIVVSRAGFWGGRGRTGTDSDTNFNQPSRRPVEGRMKRMEEEMQHLLVCSTVTLLLHSCRTAPHLSNELLDTTVDPCVMPRSQDRSVEDRS